MLSLFSVSSWLFFSTTSWPLIEPAAGTFPGQKQSYIPRLSGSSVSLTYEGRKYSKEAYFDSWADYGVPRPAMAAASDSLPKIINNTAVGNNPSFVALSPAHRSQLPEGVVYLAIDRNSKLMNQCRRMTEGGSTKDSLPSIHSNMNLDTPPIGDDLVIDIYGFFDAKFNLLPIPVSHSVSSSSLTDLPFTFDSRLHRHKERLFVSSTTIFKEQLRGYKRFFLQEITLRFTDCPGPLRGSQMSREAMGKGDAGVERSQCHVTIEHHPIELPEALLKKSDAQLRGKNFGMMWHKDIAYLQMWPAKQMKLPSATDKSALAQSQLPDGTPLYAFDISQTDTLNRHRFHNNGIDPIEIPGTDLLLLMAHSLIKGTDV